MAKKAKRTKRAKVAKAPQGPVDTVARITTVDVLLEKESPASKGVGLSLKHLGIDGHPSIAEVSGNSVLLDPARPPVIAGDNLLVFFDPELGKGICRLRLTFTYTELAELVVPAPLVDGKYAGLVK